MIAVADIRNSEPVAYFYENPGVGKELVLDCNGEYARRLLEAGYTETPLYTRAAPPAPIAEGVTCIAKPLTEDERKAAIDKWIAPPAMDREAVEAEVERIMAMSDDEILAEVDAEDVAWARAFKQGLRTGQHVSTADAPVKALRSIVAKHTRVGGYPDTHAIARDAYNLALSTLSADAIRQGEGLSNAIGRYASRLERADKAVAEIMAQSDAEIVAAAIASMKADDVKFAIRAWLDADDATHWGSFEVALDVAVSGVSERDAIIAMLKADASTMRENAEAYSEEAPSDARALHEVAATLAFKAEQIKRGDHFMQILDTLSFPSVNVTQPEATPASHASDGGKGV